ncbi:MAG TPA: bifunctional nuclease family protein [Armatimonadaceae bacterium]|jgi:bifunctional DNase/RNase|nr:bifunctional nuclease family protein [Armatimonadaceae bacterium]
MADDFRDLFKDWQPGEDASPGEEKQGNRPASDGDDNPYESTSETENRQPRSLNEKEVKVMGIWGATDPSNPDGPPKQTFVLLRDNRGRKAPIFIGPFETMAIQMALEGPSPERPMTHDLLKNVIDRLGGSVERITIDDLWQGTFYAKVTVQQQDGQYADIDARPSDAIALALRTRSPIYMAEQVIEDAAREDSDAT